MESEKMNREGVDAEGMEDRAWGQRERGRNRRGGCDPKDRRRQTRFERIECRISPFEIGATSALPGVAGIGLIVRRLATRIWPCRRCSWTLGLGGRRPEKSSSSCL